MSRHVSCWWEIACKNRAKSPRRSSARRPGSGPTSTPRPGRSWCGSGTCSARRSQGWDAFQLLEYAAGLGLDNVHFSERGFLGPLESAHLTRLRARADELGVGVELGMRSIDRFAASFEPGLGTAEEQLGAMIE